MRFFYPLALLAQSSLSDLDGRLLVVVVTVSLLSPQTRYTSLPGRAVRMETYTYNILSLLFFAYVFFLSHSYGMGVFFLIDA